jgi:hypothetical protein
MSLGPQGVHSNMKENRCHCSELLYPAGLNTGHVVKKLSTSNAYLARRCTMLKSPL